MLTSLSLPPLNYLLINFLTFSLFFIFLVRKSKQHKSIGLFFLYGWSFGFGYFITNLYWISISLTFDQDLKYLIPFVIILIPTFLGIFYGLVSFFFIILKPKKIVSALLIFSMIFGILEFVRGSIFTGFPWNLIAYSFSKQLQIISVTSIIGTYGFNLFCISLFTSPAVLFLKDSRNDIGISLIFLIVPMFFFIYGSAYEKKFKNLDFENSEYKIRVIGSNIGLDRFYYNIEPISVIEELIKLSEPDPNKKIIFVWPEGILPKVSQKQLVEYKWLFEDYFTNNHFLILGINNQSLNDKSINYYNSISVYDNNLNLINSYNKINLVPFGEFLPFEGILKSVGLKTITNNYQSFSKGKKREVIEIKKDNFLLKILPLICYEIIYSGKISDNSDFDLILNISEDGWFGQSIGPKQHFSHSIFRAIESGKYLLRSANNGIAAIINPLGIVEKKVNFGDSGFIDFDQKKIIQPTVFSKFGNKIFGLLILLYIFLIFSFNRINNE